MLVICEDCAKKYNIDETKVKGQRARFSCQECGHIIVVQKPSPHSVEQPVAEQEEMFDEQAASAAGTYPFGMLSDENQPSHDDMTSGEESLKTQKKIKKGKGASIGFYLLFALTLGLVCISLAFAYIYLRYIPQLINEQVDLRTSAITTLFAGAIKQPLLEHNSLQVNSVAERVSKLPGVAYTAVVNKRGIVEAGFFSDISRFDQVFAAQVKTEGFPRSVIEKNILKGGIREKVAQFSVGGQKIQDQGVLLQENGETVHVGIYISDVNKAVTTALLSPLSLSLVGVIFLSGLMIFLIIARSISRPLIEFTDAVNRISLGELDLVVEAKGPKEIRELAAAFERMRYSIKAAMSRLRKAQ